MFEEFLSTSTKTILWVDDMFGDAIEFRTADVKDNTIDQFWLRREIAAELRDFLTKILENDNV